MQIFSLLAVLFFAYSTTLTSAKPVSYPTVHRRDRPTCANNPSRVAGTIFGRALEPSDPSPSSLLPRAGSEFSGTVWCLPHTTTFIRISFLKVVTQPLLVDLLLSEAAGAIDDHIKQFGSAVRSTAIADSRWQFALNQFNVYAMTSHEGLMSWGTLRDAIGVLEDFMAKNQFGTGMVSIFDGVKKVGTLVIGMA